MLIKVGVGPGLFCFVSTFVLCFGVNFDSIVGLTANQTIYMRIAMTLPQQTLDFFTGVSPWENLPADELHGLIAASSLVYLNAECESLLAEQVQQGNALLLVQNGEFEVSPTELTEGKSQEKATKTRFVSEGDYVFVTANPWHFITEQITEVHAPGLVFCLNLTRLEALAKKYKELHKFFADYVKSHQEKGLYFGSGENWQEASLAKLCERTPICISPDYTIQQCAQKMAQYQISSVLVTQEDRLAGIITDKDLRSRVLASGLSPESLVSDVMTVNPVTALPEQDWLDAVCMMSERGFSHVPIVSKDLRPLGIITKSDIINQQKSNIAWLIKSLSNAANLYELMQQAWQIPHYVRFNMQGKQSFANVGQWLSRATDVMTRRLLQFYWQEHGEPPFAFCWLVYGSQARKDQLLTSDQDNGLLLAQQPDEKQALYFKNMGEYVCNGLAKCGISLCSGNIMASNPELRKTLPEAIEEARVCVAEPSNKRILNFNIFLDVRLVAGDESLFAQLQSGRAELFKTPFFLAALAREVNSCDVPLNMFQRFVYEEQSKSINLKVNAIAIINSMVRLYALAEGIKVAGTLDRLAALVEKKALSKKDCDNMRSIWLFLNELRLQSQLSQASPDNKVDVSQLAPLEKYQLKKAFQSIKRAQAAALVKFSGGLGG